MSIWRAVTIVAIGLAVGPGATAQNFNIDFGTSTGAEGGVAPASFGAASGQIGAWNGVGLGSTTALLGLDGQPTGVAIAVVGDDAAGFAPVPDLCSGDLGRLMNDNFYTSGTSQIVLTGLANGSYDVYFYDPGHSDVPTGNITANGVAISSFNASPASCTFVAGVNYAVASVPVVAGTMAIQLTVATTSSLTGLAGIQLVWGGVIAEPAVPTLSPWGIMLLASLVLAGALLALRRLI